MSITPAQLQAISLLNTDLYIQVIDLQDQNAQLIEHLEKRDQEVERLRELSRDQGTEL